ncbi:tyrosine phosphatase family-domain-containing protein [Gongronella butleri]|nr:tyrosine phosphatase family-domain-containing protein [Gongronella butleri]
MVNLTITNEQGERLVGILEKPHLKERGLVLILHGFLAHKDAMYQKKLALSLPYASYRFDFYGHGESDGVLEYPNVIKGVANLKTVARHFETQGWFIFAMVGHSGGAFAMHDFALHWHRPIQHIVSISCRFEFASAKLIDINPMWDKQMNELGYFLWEGSYRGEKRVSNVTKKQFLDAHALVNTHCKDYPVGTRVLLIYCGKDLIVPYEQGFGFQQALPEAEMVILPKAQHHLSGFHGEIIKEVLQFLPGDHNAISTGSADVAQTSSPLARVRLVDTPRWPLIDKAKNFRDVGGYMLHNRKQYLRNGSLYRSGSLQSLSASGWDTLGKLHVQAVFDLGAVNEAPIGALKSEALCRSIAYYSVPVYHTLDQQRKDNIKRWRQFMQGPDGFADVYMDLLHSGSQAYGTILRYMVQHDVATYLAQGKGSIVVCSKSGRDRVGLFTMLLMGLCHVDDALIAKDYALSAKGLQVDNELAALAKTLQCTLDELKRVTASPYHAMIKTIERVRLTYGSIEGFVQQVCGVSAQECDQLRAVMQVDFRRQKRKAPPKVVATANL